MTEQQRPETADRNVRMSPELMDALFTRDELGRRLRVEWGEPGEDGFYEPTITTDFSDDLVAAERARLLEEVERVADEQMAREAEAALHCIWPTVHLRVLSILGKKVLR